MQAHFSNEMPAFFIKKVYHPDKPCLKQMEKLSYVDEGKTLLQKLLTSELQNHSKQAYFIQLFQYFISLIIGILCLILKIKVKK